MENNGVMCVYEDMNESSIRNTSEAFRATVRVATKEKNLLLFPSKTKTVLGVCHLIMNPSTQAFEMKRFYEIFEFFSKSQIFVVLFPSFRLKMMLSNFWYHLIIYQYQG